MGMGLKFPPDHVDYPHTKDLFLSFGMGVKYFLGDIGEKEFF
jgi:hypothetical protein